MGKPVRNHSRCDMTPATFAARMRALVMMSTGEPEVRDRMARDRMARELLETCLIDNGFAEGLAILHRASPEKLDPATVTKAVQHG